MERDLDIVQQAYKQAQGLSTIISEEQRVALVAHLQHALALVRGPFLDGFWLGVIHILRGDFEQAIPYLEASLGLYVALGSEPTAPRELSLPHFLLAAPLTQPFTNRASHALVWSFLAYAQVNSGQVQPSLRSGRSALALAHGSTNVCA